MVNTDKLRGIITEKRKTGQECAQALGISSQSFSRKMKKKVFKTDEVEKLVEFLEIESPLDVFFDFK